MASNRDMNTVLPDAMIHALMESGTVPRSLLKQFLSSSPDIRRRCLDSGQKITAGALLPVHPLADIFPAMNNEQYEKLRDNIAENGILEPLWLYQGCIIDGKHRQKACIELGIDPPTRKYTGKDPVAFVVAKNLRRRHLTESQRSMVAANLATMDRGGQFGNFNAVKNEPANLPIRFNESFLPTQTQKISQDQAAKLMNVSARSLRNAKKVKESGSPELIRAIENGELAVSAGAEIVRHASPLLQEKILEEGLAIKAAQYLRGHPEEAQSWTDVQQAHSIIQKLQKNPPEQKHFSWPDWVVLSQKMPNPGSENIVWVPDHSPQLGHRAIARFNGPGPQDWSPRITPSHWMPAPDAPFVPHHTEHRHG